MGLVNIVLKKSKTYKRIKMILIVVVIVLIVITIVTLIHFLDYIGLVSIEDIEDDVLDFVGPDEGDLLETDISKVIEGARIVDEYIAVNDFYISFDESEWSGDYTYSGKKGTNAFVYVYWSLGKGQEEIFVPTEGEVRFVGDLSWKKITEISDVSDLRIGDVCFYELEDESDLGIGDNYFYEGRMEHDRIGNNAIANCNIYAGNGQYWENSSDEHLKQKGTITRNDVPSFVYRKIRGRKIRKTR